MVTRLDRGGETHMVAGYLLQSWISLQAPEKRDRRICVYNSQRPGLSDLRRVTPQSAKPFLTVIQRANTLIFPSIPAARLPWYRLTMAQFFDQVPKKH